MVLAQQELNKTYAFLFDYGNTGELFRIIFTGNKEKIISWLLSISRDVRYSGIITKLPRGSKNKSVPCGILHHCKYYSDKYKTSIPIVTEEQYNG